jgi:sporulation integral membrane protein YlbJ
MSSFRTRRHLIALILFTYLLLLFFFSDLCIEGAKTGLLLWFEQLLPSLLPFLILSGLCVRFNLTKTIGKLFYPFLSFLPISKEGCYPIVIGLLSGYPVGAKTCADMLSDKTLSKREASFLLCLCNNASPMFLTGFAASNCLGLPEYRYVFFLIIILSGLCSSLLLYHIYFKKMPDTLKTQRIISKNNTAFQKGTTHQNNTSAMQKLDEAILSSFEVMVKVGGYIILFSIPVKLLSSLLSPLSSNTAMPFLSVLTTALPGILELSVGTSIAGASALPLLTKIVLTLSICAFGGLSALAQTKSVIGSSGLSIKYYIISKLLQAIFAGSFGYLLFRFFLPL